MSSSGEYSRTDSNSVPSPSGPRRLSPSSRKRPVRTDDASRIEPSTHAIGSIRVLAVSWLLQFKMIMRSPFDGFGNVIYPLFFATVAFFVFRAGHSPRTLIYASFGAAVMGMWSSVSTWTSCCSLRQDVASAPSRDE